MCPACFALGAFVCLSVPLFGVSLAITCRGVLLPFFGIPSFICLGGRCFLCFVLVCVCVCVSIFREWFGYSLPYPFGRVHLFLFCSAFPIQDRPWAENGH